MDISNTVAELQHSPLFNLSLSSKELFHSNFIAWLGETFPEHFGNLLFKNFKDAPPIIKITSVKREKRNIDLTFGFDSVQIVVENKVKSIPDRQQLINYKKKYPHNTLFLLLTLVEPNFKVEDLGWKIMTYEKLSLLLIQMEKEIEPSRKYEKLLLPDYIQFTRNLSSLAKTLRINFSEDKFNIYSPAFNLFKSIRLHDLLIKYKYSQLLKEIQASLQVNFIDKEVIIAERYNHNLNRDRIVLDFNLVRGKGVINIEHSNCEEIIFGIMIDGIRYNQFLYSWGETEKIKTEIANSLRQERKWFYFNFLPDNDTFPKKKAFNKYGKSMIYRAAKISQDVSLQDLLHWINLDVARMIELSKIVIKKHSKVD